jgi:hypothetical protein
MAPHCKHALFSQECFLPLCFVLSVIDGKIKQRVCIKSSKFLKRLAGLIHVSSPVECQLKMNVQGEKSLGHEDHRQTIHELADNVGFSYGVCQEILTENLNMHYIAAKLVK